MWILGYIEGASKAENATEDAVKKYFGEQMTDSGQNYVDRVNKAVRQVKFKMVEGDPQGVVKFLCYFYRHRTR